MLTAEGCQSRRQRLWNAIKADLDWILIGDPQHQMYLANYYADPFVFRSVNSASVLLLHRDGRSILVADSMVKQFAELALVDVVLTPTWYDGHHSAPQRATFLVQNVLKTLSEEGGTRFGIESGRLPAGITEGLRLANSKSEFIAIDPVIHRMKRQKDVDEIELIRQSIASIEAGFRAARSDIHAGITELDAFHIIERASRDELKDQMPVYGDFNSGLNTLKGGFPTLRTIEKGDLYLLDYSVVVYGYRGDFANAWVVDGKANDQYRQMNEVSREALATGEALLYPGTPCSEIDAAVRAAFAKRGVDKYFVSHSGHGIGLGHPDPPYIVPESEDILMTGDVVTLEPSQKIDGVGTIRVEHNYLITEHGPQRLSHHELTVD